MGREASVFYLLLRASAPPIRHHGLVHDATRALPFREPLADALLPPLLHRLNNATQLLTAVNALFAHGGGGGALLERRGDDLGDASETLRELGWLVGVLASAGGANLLLERRERKGLAIMADAVREGLLRTGRDLALPDVLPELAPDVHDGWQIPWAVGALLWTAGTGVAEGSMLRFSIESDGEVWRIACPIDDAAAFDPLAARIDAALPEARLDWTSDRIELLLPAAWLR